MPWRSGIEHIRRRSFALAFLPSVEVLLSNDVVPFTLAKAHAGKTVDGGDGGNITTSTTSSSNGRPPTPQPAKKGPPVSTSSDSGSSVASLTPAPPIATSPPPFQTDAEPEPAPVGAPPPQTLVQEGEKRAMSPAAFGVGRNSDTGRDSASGEGGIAVEAAEDNPAAAALPPGRSGSTTTTDPPNTESSEKAELAVVATAVEVGEGGAGERPGKNARVQGEPESPMAAAGQKTRASTLWDLTQPPTIGNLFDCLDYFVNAHVRYVT